ncbi:MAG: IS630 family transposase [Merismopedia sp. SIO2A8]|nr:IS630 family transposase [Merismopedia sp. SIO2A8]
MIKIEFSPEAIEQLNYERYHHPHPHVQKKMEVLYLKSQKLSHKEIRRICRICKTTLVTYLRQYQQQGIEGLKQLNYKGQPSELNPHAERIKAYFKEHPPRTVAEAQAKIEQMTGIKRSPTQIKAFLKRIGMRCRKVGFIPGKGADPDKIDEQEQFRKHQLEPLLAEAKAGRRAVFFVDAAHFVHRAYLGFVWCFTRIFIPSPSGRKRFNVLGAINAVTKEVVMVTHESYINAGSVVELWVELATLGLEVPITIVLDNARYQKCPFVKDVAYFLGIELLYLPSYSPHLNLIERLWKFVRNECLYSTYYENFESFKAAIAGCLEKANTDHREKLESLLRWNFQSFKKVHILTV